MQRILQYFLLSILLFLLFYVNFKSDASIYSHPFFAATKKENVAILSSSLKPRYLFLLPFTVASWNKINVSTIIFLIGDQNEFERNKQAATTINFLKTMNTKIIYLKSEKLSPVSLSQIVRLFPASLPISNIYDPENTIFITSDADLFVFHLKNHAPNLLQNKTLHLYNSRCCNPVNIPPKRGKHKVRMFPIGTIGATIKTWRNIMGFDRQNYTFKDIENYVINEFGSNFFHFNDSNNPRLIGSAIWYADQSLISYKLDLWLKGNNHSMSESIEAPRRIDRIKWPQLSKFKEMKIEDWDDCHQPTAGFIDNEWKKFKPFLEFAFRTDKVLLDKLQKYRDEFVSK
jgi:hypothetical protein